MNSPDHRAPMLPLGRELAVHYDGTPRSAAMNMALDEALLERATRPTLRFYRWDHPALSFGYFGRFDEVKQYAPDRDLVRRWTGGGVVFHGEDLTYAIILPAAPTLGVSSRSVYIMVHTALRDTLLSQGQRAALAFTESLTASSACFDRPVVADVLIDEQKVAGAAHRRTRKGLLHQGSIQSVNFPDDLVHDFAQRLALECHWLELGRDVLERAHEIAHLKYATEAWLIRR